MPSPTADAPGLDARVARGSEAAADAEGKAAFHLRLRARGVRDRDVLRAFELVPRHPFVPTRYAALAGRDVAVPLPCGQTMEAPSLVARMVEALDVRPGQRVLEIGTGSGHGAAVLAALGAQVRGLERVGRLAAEAQARLAALGLSSVAVVHADGLRAEPGRFDRVLVHGALTADAAAALRADTRAGVLVCVAGWRDPHVVVRLDQAGVTPVCAGRLQPMRPGLAAAT